MDPRLDGEILLMSLAFWHSKRCSFKQAILKKNWLKVFGQLCKASGALILIFSSVVQSQAAAIHTQITPAWTRPTSATNANDYANDL